MDGFDVEIEGDAKGYYQEFYNSWRENKRKIEAKSGKLNSIYEVGCGSGATLFLFLHDNPEIKAGVIDYSPALCNVAKMVAGEDNIICDGAINLQESPKYDLVYSDSVFVYFTDFDYARTVLEKMYNKSNKAIVLTEVYDAEKKDECINYRRSKMTDYDEQYKGLDKLFYPRSFFKDFANEHNLKIEFSEVKNSYYWNSGFQYNIFMYK